MTLPPEPVEARAWKDCPTCRGRGLLRYTEPTGNGSLRREATCPCQTCAAFHAALAQLRERVREALRRSVNANCSCGGGGSHDPHACPVCRVWHATMGAINALPLVPS